MNATGTRAEHDEVLLRISARESMAHIAHAAVSTFVSLTFVAAAAKLWWDFSEYSPGYYQAALVVAAIAAVYAIIRAAIGARYFRRERVELARLMALRAELHIDDAASLLPRLS